MTALRLAAAPARPSSRPGSVRSRAARESQHSQFAIRNMGIIFSERPRLAIKTRASADVADGAEKADGDVWGGGSIIDFDRSSKADRILAPAGANPFIILPGFGNDTSDYISPFGFPEQSLKFHLEQRGWKVFVPEVIRKDWIKVARGILTLDFWKGTCTVDPAYTWYLEEVAATVERALQETGAEQVDLVAHSAGGWLARAYLAKPEHWPATEAAAAAAAAVAGGAADVCNPHVGALVSLGSPHIHPPPGAPDMTRGALASVNKTWPGAYFESVKYVCVTGRSVKGNPEAEKGTIDRYAFGAYEQVCGRGEGVEGDAVVPNDCALLEGAENLVIDGVFHSMSKLGTYGEESGYAWYGSDAVVDLWLAKYLALK